MDNNLLEKHKNDPAWAEVIRLYSGLFDTQQEREDFIIDLAETDILLAAECKTSSTDDETNLNDILFNKCNELAKNKDYENNLSILNPLLALFELNRIETLVGFLGNIPKRNIRVFNQVIKQIPKNEKSKKVLIIILLSNPAYFISAFLDSIKVFENENIVLSAEEINNIFQEIVIKEDIKSKYLLQFIKKYNSNIKKIENYNLYGEKHLFKIRNYEDLKYLIKIFDLGINIHELIYQLLETKKNNKIYMLLQSLQEMTIKAKIVFLTSMIESKDKNLIAGAYLYINHNPIISKNFKNIEIVKCEINYEYLISQRIFYKIHNALLNKIDNASKFRPKYEVGDNIKLYYSNTGLRHHFFNLKASNHRNLYTFLMPFNEASEDISNLNKYALINARIIHIDNKKNVIYISNKQLYIKNTFFDFDYIDVVKIGDIVDCRIGKRDEKKSTASIIGINKNQKAVLSAEKWILEGITKVEALVHEIKNNIVYLTPIRFDFENNHSKIENGHKSITKITTKRITIFERFKEFLTDRLKVGYTFLFSAFNSQIGLLTKKNIISLFPNKKWFLLFLIENGIIEKIPNVNNVEGGKYIVVREVESQLFDDLKEKLLSEDFSSNFF